MIDAPVRPDWFLDWRGHTWDSTQLTGEHAAAVAEMLGFPPPWDWFNLSELHPVHGPLQTMSLLAAFVCVDQQVQGRAARSAVLEAIKDATLDEIVTALRFPE